MAAISAQERVNILKLVVGMFNAAPGAAYLQEFAEAYVAMGRDYSALARALSGTQAFQSQYPANLSNEAFAAKFLGSLGLQQDAQANAWVKARLQVGDGFGPVMLEALVAIVETRDRDFVQAQQLLANKAAVVGYFSVEQGKSSDDLAFLQSVLSKVQAQSDVSSPKALEALIAAGTGVVEPGNPDPGNPDPGNPDPGNPQPEIKWVEVATSADASTTLRDLVADAQLRISGKNQTAANAGANQRFDTVGVEGAKGESLVVQLDNTSKAGAELRVALLKLGDKDASTLSQVRTLKLESAGAGEAGNRIEKLDAARVETLELSGTQALFLGLENAAQFQGPAAQVKPLVVDGSALAGALHLRVDAALLNAVEANQTVRLVGGASGKDVLELGAGAQATAKTTVSGFETLRMDGGGLDATHVTGVQQYQGSGAEWHLLNLQGGEAVQLGVYDAGTKLWSNGGKLQQFHAAQADAPLNLVFKSGADNAGAVAVQNIATHGFATLNLKLDTVAALQKGFMLDLRQTAVHAQLQPSTPSDATSYPTAADVPVGHWTKTQLSTVVVTGGTGDVKDALNLQVLPATVKQLDVSGYLGKVTVTLMEPLVSDIGGVRYNTGNTTIKVGAYGLDAKDTAHAAGAPSVTTFDFRADAVDQQTKWSIGNFKGSKAVDASLGNMTVLKVGALGVHSLADMQMSQNGADTVITGANGQKFQIVLTGLKVADLGLENFAFS